MAQSTLKLTIPPPPGGWRGHEPERYVPLGPAVELVVTAAGLAEGGRLRDPLAVIIPTDTESYYTLHRHFLGITPYGGHIWCSITGHHGLDQPDQVHVGKNLRSVPESTLGLWLIEEEGVRAGDVLVLQPARDLLRRSRVVLLTLQRTARRHPASPAPPPVPAGDLAGARAALLTLFDQTLNELGRRLQATLLLRTGTGDE